jgi:hypothetical protein
MLPATTALVDLSNACQGGADHPRWDRYVLLRQRLIDEGFDRVRAIGDNSLRFKLPAIDVGHLDGAIGRREVQLVPYADPYLVQEALADASISLVSNDRFRGLRRQFPSLAGFDRVLAFRFDGTDVHLHRSPLTPIEDAEASRAAEDEDLARLGYRHPDHRDLLRWDWRCSTEGCRAAFLPQLDELPYCDDGVACCPACDATLERLGLATGGLEIKLSVDGDVRERLALAVGAAARLGRGAGPGRLDVSPLLDGEGGRLVSRRHVEVANHDGRLRVKELGSRNGTEVRRADGSTAPLQAGSVVVLGADDVACLAGQLELQLSGRRWPRARFVDIRVTSAPSATRAVAMR